MITEVLGTFCQDDGFGESPREESWSHWIWSYSNGEQSKPQDDLAGICHRQVRHNCGIVDISSPTGLRLRTRSYRNGSERARGAFNPYSSLLLADLASENTAGMRVMGVCSVLCRDKHTTGCGQA
ncbi:hypothetical protein A0H81_07630 [Grifola frondosa]|uniref:Uncharacterized protein n=1 Tax=Grifola frondosa TaxID=5627 RepID=A0A1C7M5G4_GRIFR|nr:hypothetical protein A0H81_07630 [Grifola frondosa]